MIREGEQRGLLQVSLQVGTRELLLWNTHLDYRPDDVERWSSAGEILEEFARSKEELPVVLCGDLNDVPESRTLVRLKDRFMDAWESAGAGESRTHSSAIPSKRIDYILIRRGSGIRVLKAWTIDSRASDHRPVVADLEWR
jgi:endonuclease/exonuclease/phosphatase family metal-dependent hydrolase